MDTKPKKQKTMYIVRHGEKVMPLAVYCDKYNISYNVVFNRMRRMKLSKENCHIKIKPGTPFYELDLANPAHARVLSKKRLRDGRYEI